eukprot:GCRY01000413.1.p1 GENE.GCRY01000413.1~~GCRY01000413.1.p1  ORF type:complete len:325 (+),score=74.06 GCRY01000413.1:579-1553(+)
MPDSAKDKLPIIKVNENTEKPVVVVLGWLGSSPKHVKKYVDFYSEQGFDVIWHIPPFLDTMLRPWRIRKSAEAFVAQYFRHFSHADSLSAFGVIEAAPLKKTHLLENTPHKATDTAVSRPTGTEANALQPRPTFVHTMSGNGLNFYAHIVSAIHRLPEEEKQWWKQSLVGCVVDSAPPPLSPNAFVLGTVDSIAGILSAGKNVDGTSQKLLPKLEPFLTPLYRSILNRRKNHMTALEDAVLCTAPDLPAPSYLYIYGGADELVPPAHVESWVQRHAATGASVAKTIIPNSPHVQHLRVRPDLYTRAVRSFVRECLESRARGILR